MLRGRTDGDRQIEELLLDRSASLRVREGAEEKTLLHRSGTGLRVALYVPLLRPQRLLLS